MNMTPELVKALKEEGVDEPEYYLVECKTPEEALVVAEFFDADEYVTEFIRHTSMDFFPLRIGRSSDDKFLILYSEKQTKLSMHHETIDFNNWHIIRKENVENNLYQMLGMDEKLY